MIWSIEVGIKDVSFLSIVTDTNQNAKGLICPHEWSSAVMVVCLFIARELDPLSHGLRSFNEQS